jgi:hypothetical protein
MKIYIKIDRKSDNCRYSERDRESVDLAILPESVKLS